MAPKNVMIIKNSDDLHLESMTDSQNRTKLFRLIWIQNLGMTLDPYFFGLFKDTAPNGKYLLAKIPPESLTTYTPGAFFLDGYRTNHHEEEGETLTLTFRSLEKNTFKTVSEVISGDFYDLRHDNPLYSKKQWCVVFETDSQIIIFPCFLIGAAYYFLSTSMRIQLLSQNLKGLYYPDTVTLNEKTKEASIKLKSNAADDDAKDIVRFITDKNAGKHWDEVVNNIRKMQFSKPKNETFVSVQFMADFPTAEDLEITVRAIRRKDPSSGKEKVLVLEMLNENSSFQFNWLTTYRDKKEPQRVDVTKRIKAIRTRNFITGRPPTNRLAQAEIEDNHLIKNPNKEKIRVTKETIEEDDKDGDKKEKPVPVVETGIGSADIGLAEPEHDGDPDVRPGAVRRVPAEEEKEVHPRDYFTLRDFELMFAPFAENTEVQNAEMHGPYIMPRSIASGTKGSLLGFYDRQHTKGRRFLYATFTYQAKNICVIEIDQIYLPGGCASYVLVSNKNRAFLEDAEEMLRRYVEYEKVETMAEDVKAKGMAFLSKNHPAKKTEEHYELWRRKLLMRIGMV